MKKHQILIVGSAKEWALENLYYRHIKGADVAAVSIFDCSKYYSKSLITRLRNRIGDLNIYKNVNIELISFCNKNKPSIVWIFKGVEIFAETLVTLKNMGIVTVNYNPDHPFHRTIVAHGGKNILDCVPLYTYHFCYSLELAEKISNDYNIESLHLPFGYELNEAAYIIASQMEEINRACFVGNADKIRSEMVCYLAANNVDIDVFGHGWNKAELSKYPRLRFHGGVAPIDLYYVLRRYKFQLNIFRPHNVGSHNMRTFEIPAVGGVQLAPYSKEQDLFFDAGKSIFYYHKKEECLQQATQLLNLSTQDTAAARLAARHKSLDGNYSYQHRTEAVIKFLKERQHL